MVSPHFITLLPLWAAVPTSFGGTAPKPQNLSGLVPRPEFPPSSGCPQPHPIPSSQPLQVSQFLQRAVCITLTWSRPSQAPPGTQPLLRCPLRPQWLGSSDTKHDPMMSYPSMCICIILAKGCSYVTMQCTLTVCRRFEGLQLT